MTIGKPLPPRTATLSNSPLPHPGSRPAAVKREPKTLTVGREITLSGEITSCDRLVVEGELDVENCLILRATGRINGTVRYRDIEIERGGKIAGTLEIADEAEADKRREPGQAAKAPHVVA